MDRHSLRLILWFSQRLNAFVVRGKFYDEPHRRTIAMQDESFASLDKKPKAV